MPSHFVTRLLQQSLKSSLSCSLLWVSQTKVRTLKRTLLRQTLESFGIRKSHTTAYHPKGDGMVEQFNQSLLQLPCSYVDNKADWEWYLPLVLYAYCTAAHSSTGVSTYILMFGRQPQTTTSDKSSSFDPLSYQSQLTAKMAELHDFVESKLALAASKQKCSYNKRSNQRSFNVTILFGFLFPKQESWIRSGKGIGEYMLSKDLWMLKLLMAIEEKLSTLTESNLVLYHLLNQTNWMIQLKWVAPLGSLQVEHLVDCKTEEEPSVRQNPSHQCRSPDYYRPEARGRA